MKNRHITWSRYGNFLIIPLLILVTIGVFAPAIHYDYVKLDDDQYVASNPYVLTGLTSRNIEWALKTVHEAWWLPLLWISYMLDVELFGPEPFGFHLTNILLHTINVTLLFWALFRLSGSRWRSAFAAALFAIHPLRIEAVVWITARKDVLSGLFFMLALLAYVRYVESPSRRRYGLLTLLMLGGLLSKAILIILPFILLLLDYWPLQRAGDPWKKGEWGAWWLLLKEKTLLFMLAAVFMLINIRTHESGIGMGSGFSLVERVALIFPNYWAYLDKVFRPMNLSIIYPENDAINWMVSIASAVSLLLASALFMALRKRAPYLLTGWLWFLLALFPVIRGVRLGLAAYADRFTYLPGIGLSIMLVWSAADTVRAKRNLKAAFLLAGGILLLTLFILSAKRLPDWRNSETMFSHLVAYAPDHYIANNNYGKVLLEAGSPEEALGYFAKAAAIPYNDTSAAANYADALLRLARNEEAIHWTMAALEERTAECPNLNIMAAFAYLNIGQPANALPHLDKAIKRHPHRIGWQLERVRALYEAGDAPAAREEIARLQSEGYPHIRNFDSLIPHYALLWRQGERMHAWHFFKNNLDRNPQHVKMLQQAAWLLATDEQPPAPPLEAIRLAREALRFSPAPHPVLLDTLAVAYAANGQFDDALRIIEQSKTIAKQQNRPDLINRHERLAERFRNREMLRE